MTKFPFIDNEPVVPPIFVSRESELNFLKNNTFFRNESVVINGYDYIGKSSIVQTFRNEILSGEYGEKIFPLKIRMTQFYHSIKADFLSVVTHELCANIWTLIMGNKYSELLEDTLLNVRKDQSISKFEKSLKRIFKIVTSEKLSGTGKNTKEFGGKFFVEGKITEENESYSERKPLQAFEFMLLLDELMEILEENGFNKIVIICDELNHLPPKINFDLFSNYLNIFSSKKIIFVIVAVDPRSWIHDPDRVDMENLINSFSQRLDIGPFNSAEDVKILIENSLKFNEIDDLIFQEGIYERIYEITEGFPLFTVKLCNVSYYMARKSQQEIVKSDLIERLGIPFSKWIARYEGNYGTMNRGEFEKFLSSYYK